MSRGEGKRGAVARFAALWAVLSGSSPLPALIGVAATTPQVMGPQAVACSAFGSSTAGPPGLGGSGVVINAQVPRPASLGTLDELVALWPVLNDAEGLLLFVDESDSIADGFAVEVWMAVHGVATKVASAAYTLLHASEPLLLGVTPGDDGGVADGQAGSPPGPGAGQQPSRRSVPDGGGDDTAEALVLSLEIGLLTPVGVAIDDPIAGVAIGIEALVMRLPPHVAVASNPSGGPYGTYWGPGSLRDMTPTPGATPLPAPMVMLRSMPAAQAIDEASEQYVIDALAEGDDLQAFCVNLEWIGHGGVQCCQLYLSEEAAAVHCRMQFLAALIACIAAGGAPGGVVIHHLLKRCMAGLPATWKPCLVVALGVGVLALTCYLLARWGKSGCIAQELHDNLRSLADHGCLPIPTGP